jgi:hypothetical protein
MNRPKLSIIQPTNDSPAPHLTTLTVTGWLDYVSSIAPTVSGWIIYNNTKYPAGGAGFMSGSVYPNPNWQLTFNISTVPANSAICVHVRAQVSYPSPELPRTASDSIVLNVT